MELSNGGQRVFRNVPNGVSIAGMVVLMFEVLVLVISTVVSHSSLGDGADRDTSSAAVDDGMVRVTYLITGTAKTTSGLLTNGTGGDEHFEEPVPLRRDFRFRKGEFTYINAHLSGDDGRLTCTLTMDGVIVVQRTGTNITCSGGAGEMDRLKGARLPEGAPAAGTSTAPSPSPSSRVADVTASPSKIMKLPRYQGKRSPVLGRVGDPFAGVSYARLGGLWGPVKSEDLSFGSEDSISREQSYNTEGTWSAVLRSGRVSPKHLGHYRGVQQLFHAALAFQDEHQDSGFPDETTHKDVVSQPMTVGGHKAWVHGREMHYDKSNDGYRTKMELSVIVVIDTGDLRPAMVHLSIPDTHSRWWPDINQVIDSIRALD